jgi:glycosyltransferase involved in cell wall biosynthesis
VALVEAMAAGVPVVTTPVGGIPELVRDGENGVLVPSDEPRALAGAVDGLLRDAGLRKRLGNGALASAREYDLPRCVAELRGRFGA